MENQSFRQISKAGTKQFGQIARVAAAAFIFQSVQGVDNGNKFPAFRTGSNNLAQCLHPSFHIRFAALPDLRPHAVIQRNLVGAGGKEGISG